MDIKAQDVKTLREKTGAGMLDCKKALVEAGGDFAKAEKLLKELGLAAAAKRSGRATNEGRVFSYIEDGKGALLELSCETDFVARNSDFIAMGEQMTKTVVEKELTSVTEELEAKIRDAVSVIKENMSLRRFHLMKASANEMLTAYIHGEGRIGVLVKVVADKPEALKNPKVTEFAFDSALHIAAFSPMFLSREKVDQNYLQEQESIFMKQAESLGKPQNVLVGIAKGKMNKHLAEICFYEQPFVKDDKRSVRKVMEDISKEIGSTISVSDYLYYRVGEEV